MMKIQKILKRLFLVAASLLALALSLLVVAYTVIEHDGNFHEVEHGLIYRSAQLDAKDLTERTKQVGLKSILNLRGESSGDDWYESELAVSRSMGLTHLNYRMSASESLNLNQMQEILELIEKAPKPLLIHCKAGADRTGLVAAIYLSSKDASMEKVHEALSMRYGHLPIFHWSDTIAMDKSLSLFLSKK